MPPEHALLLKTYDSETDGGVQFLGHSAFDDPQTPPDAPRARASKSAPRRSSERGCTPALSLVSEFGSARCTLTRPVPFRLVIPSLSRQLVEEPLGRLQIEGVKTVGEPAVCWSQEIASLSTLSLFGPEARHTHRGAQLERLCLLRSRS